MLAAWRPLLQGWGIEACCVLNGAAAWDALGRGFAPDVILCDQRLRAGEDGFELLQALLARCTAARGAMVSGEFSSPALAQAEDEGYVVLRKPLDPATLQALAQWRRAHAALDLLLVRGNHDARAGDPPPELGVQVVDEPLALGGLRLCHHPQERADGYVLAGHLHPCVVLGGAAHQRLRLPCFHFGARVGVLPAFGAFTGMHAVRAQPGERLFVVAGDTVAPLPPIFWAIPIFAPST